MTLELMLALALIQQVLLHAVPCQCIPESRRGERVRGQHKCKPVLLRLLGMPQTSSKPASEEAGKMGKARAQDHDFQKVDCGFFSRQALGLFIDGAPQIRDVSDPDRPRPHKNSAANLRKLCTLVADLMTPEASKSWTEDQCVVMRAALRILPPGADKATILSKYNEQGMDGPEYLVT
jgi:hypothetical protein